jgi:solute carrier family 1 (high affinity glutamate transporter) protein 3
MFLLIKAFARRVLIQITRPNEQGELLLFRQSEKRKMRSLQISEAENGNFYCSCLRTFFRVLRSDLLLTFILVGVVIGFLVGTLVNGTVNDISNIEEKKTTIMLIGFPGELFMNMIKMLILPLIVASIVTAVASLDSKATAKIGRRTIIYYLSTTFIAVLLGILLVMTIKPGVGAKSSKDGTYAPKFRTVDSFLDLIRYVVMH